MQTSDWIAFGALIISLIALWVSWLTYRRDKSHLKLTLKFQGNSTSNGKYHITITNDGRRPSTLSEVAAHIGFRKRQVFYEQEITLDEGKTKSISALLQLFRVRHPLEIMSFEARDTTGKKYRAFTLLIVLQILSVWKPGTN